MTAGGTGKAGALAGQVAVITGGAGGIGSATAASLAREGATVVVLDRSLPREPGFPARLAIPADVTSADSLRAAAETVKGEFGGCDVLIIAAGVAVTGAAGQSTEADWDRVFEVNVRGAWLTFREFHPVLRRPGRVVTVASAAGLRPLPELAAYSASKAALISLTRSIAIDYAQAGIRANCVCPGQVDTPLAARVQDARSREERAAVAAFADYPIKRPASPAEIAAAITFLSGPGNGYLTGAVLAVDGGRTLH
jgi:NAD(P)-dependent dehydrogenase (short-subunit alcohol dehydrogenase family)